MADAVIRFRVDIGAELGIGPGKIALLERSVRAVRCREAARALGMSYRRAWQLLAVSTRVCATPVTHAQKGGQHGGGSSLTPFGRRLIRVYRAFDAETQRRGARAFRAVGAKARRRAAPAVRSPRPGLPLSQR